MAKRFVKEKPKPPKQLVILSNGKSTSKSLKTLMKACKDKGYIPKHIKIGTASIDLEDGVTGYIDDENKKPFKIDPDTTVILCRRGVVNNTFTLSFLLLSMK